MPYATLVPKEGAKHNPSVDPRIWDDPKVTDAVKRGMLGPWSYQFDGKVRSIYKPGPELPKVEPQAGLELRPIPLGEAEVALAFFTPYRPGEDVGDSALVDIEYHDGELEWSTAAPSSVTGPCHLCGQDIPIGELSKHVVECAGGKSAAGTEDDVPLEDLDRAQLAKIADDNDVEYPATANKATLLKLLEAAGVK